MNLKFINISTSHLFDKWVGSTTKIEIKLNIFGCSVELIYFCVSIINQLRDNDMQQISGEELLRLPLFMGMSEAEVSHVAESYGLNCHWYVAAKSIVEEDMPVDRLLIIYNGRAKRDSWAHDRSWKLTEVVEAPTSLQAERLFGLSTHYTASFRSFGGCAVLEVPKSSVYRLLETSQVFRFNFINLISSELQRRSRMVAKTRGGSVEMRVCHFVEQISSFPTGQKEISITMSQLANELSTSRINVSEALHNLENKNLIKVKRGHLLVPSISLLLKVMH